jgi:hypothetical protein
VGIIRQFKLIVMLPLASVKTVVQCNVPVLVDLTSITLNPDVFSPPVAVKGPRLPGPPMTLSRIISTGTGLPCASSFPELRRLKLTSNGMPTIRAVLDAAWVREPHQAPAGRVESNRNCERFMIYSQFVISGFPPTLRTATAFFRLESALREPPFRSASLHRQVLR